MKYTLTDDQDKCIVCKTANAVWERLNTPPAQNHFILPVELPNTVELCEKHSKEFSRVRENYDGPRTALWDYIAGYATSYNY